MKPQASTLKRTLIQLFGLFIITNLILTSAFTGLAAPPQQEEDPFPTLELSAEALSVEPGVIQDRPGATNDKLDTSMNAIAGAAEESASAAVSLAESKQMNTSDGRVQAQITINPANWESALLAIKNEGGEVTGIGFDNTMIQAWVLVTSLEATAMSDAILYIRRPAELILDEVDAISEGFGVTNGPAWHAAGYQGAGVKVAIIDGGFEGYPSLLGTDLPASVTVKNFVDGEDDSQVNGTTKHGTACAEIVYDFAPGATMYLVKINTLLDLDEAVTWLRDTHNVDVISASFGFLYLTPGDGTGYLADLVQHARDGGILWVQAAGNHREEHWGGTWYDPDTDDYLNFTDTQEINYFGPGDGSAFGFPAGILLRFYMRWSDWTNVNQDYDLHLLRYNGSTWEIIASSTDTQNGSPGQTPTEFVAAITTGDTVPYGFAVQRVNGNQNVDFEVLAPDTARLDEFVHARSLVGPADAPAAMTVAALDVVSPYPQEDYSSEGPTNGPGGIATGGAIKPDISGFANVNTVSYGTVKPFNGTSSATPHVAGAATLALSAYPGYTPDQLQSFLESRAVDMGPAGKDTQYGYGRLYLGDPPAPQPGDTVSLVPDDGVQETGIGVNDGSAGVAFQFIWLNRFTPNPADYPFTLNEIWVMFDDSTGTANVNVGDAIDLVVYEDADGDPANGATWLATFNETVQSVDGSTWSVYSLFSPVILNGPAGDVLIGAINRYTVSGVSPSSFPAALDTTVPQGRSWTGWWSADPPNPAILPTDDTFGTIESVTGGAFTGNWLIRGYGKTSTGDSQIFLPIVVRNFGLPSQPPGLPMPGVWSGTTNQDYPVEFTVASSSTSLSQYNIKYRVSCEGGSLTREGSILGNWPITHSNFNISDSFLGHVFEGTFNSTTSAHGTWSASFDSFVGHCSGSGTWTAAR